MKMYIATYGTTMLAIEGESLEDARREALRVISGEVRHLIPPAEDEVSVRRMRDGELAGLLG